MNESQLRSSLALHETRLARSRRQVAYRHGKHVFYEHKSRRSSAERKSLAAKWRKLEVAARKDVEREEGDVSRRRRQVAAAEAAHVEPREKAVRFAKSYAGKAPEQPAGSNSSPIISRWQRQIAGGAPFLDHAPWCGVFAGVCLEHAGVKGVTSRIAAVAFIEDDARSHRAPYRGWTTDPRGVLRGDLVVLFGRGVHVEVVVSVDVARGLVYTVGGNTSSGAAGSQSNGGGCYARVRSIHDVHGFALVNYPG